MISVAVERDSQQRVSTFSCRGHADAAPAGEDVVCAAVSAVVQLAVFGVTERLGIAARVTLRGGHVRLYMPAYGTLSTESADRAAFLLDTTMAMLAQLAEQHPRYIQVQ